MFVFVTQVYNFLVFIWLNLICLDVGTYSLFVYFITVWVCYLVKQSINYSSYFNYKKIQQKKTQVKFYYPKWGQSWEKISHFLIVSFFVKYVWIMTWQYNKTKVFDLLLCWKLNTQIFSPEVWNNEFPLKKLYNKYIK